MTARTFICTWNNPEEEPDVLLERIHNTLKAVYTVGQLEKGENGTPHIQFAINFKSPVRGTKFKKWPVHWEKARRDSDVYAYVSKEETRVSGPWEFGIKPVRLSSKEDWDEVRQKAMAGKIDEVPAEIFIKHYRNLQAISKDYQVYQDKDADSIRCVWYYGQPGVGKSHRARVDFPDFYPKDCNQWWDGYRGQPSAIIDDVDKFNPAMGHHLKKWADRYACNLQAKGGYTANSSNLRNIVVTSNYKPRDLWGDDDVLCRAIERRFEFIHMLGRDDIRSGLD